MGLVCRHERSGKASHDGISHPDVLVEFLPAEGAALNAVPKTVVSHREHGRAMILKKDGNRRTTIRYDEVRDKNVEDQVLHPDLLVHFG